MKTMILALLVSVNCYAEKYDYKKFWSDSGPIKTNETSAFGVKIKTSPIFSNLPIATVSYTKNNKEPKEKVIGLLKKSVTSAKWSFDKMDGLEIYETYSKESGTIYRLAFNTKNNEFSLASIAVRYLLPTYLEVHLVQMNQLKTTKNSSNKFTRFMNIFLQNAYAQLDVNLNDSQITEITDAIRGLGADLSTTTNAMGTSLTTASGEMSAAGNNMAGSVNNLSQTVRDLTSPGNVARTAAIAGVAFGVTSTLASMATNFLVNGTMSMLRNLYYEAAGELKPEEKEARLRRFENTMKSFTELSPRLNELANKMAATSIEITLASGITQEQYLTNIDQEIEKARKAKTEASIDCADCLSEAVLKIEQLENLKNIVRATGNKTKEDLSKACEKMDALYSDWVNAEYTMLNSRRLILQDLLIFNGQIVENTQQQDVLQEARKKINSCKATSQKILNEISTQMDVAQCTQDTANMSLPVCRRYFAHTEILQNCDNLANTQLNETQKIELEEATARLSTSLSQFSKSLASMSCEKNAASCSKAQMDIARSEVSESFRAVGEQCPTRSFAIAMKKSTAIKAPVANAPPVKDTRSFLERIFSSFKNNTNNLNKNAAESLTQNY